MRPNRFSKPARLSLTAYRTEQTAGLIPSAWAETTALTFARER
ncbi:MAG: hypothetical protein ACR2L9_11405 [Solirubrobacteraceae bacterium]